MSLSELQSSLVFVHLPRTGLEFAETAELYCAISLYDQLASNMSHKGTVQSMLTSVPALNPGFYSASCVRPRLHAEIHIDHLLQSM